MKFISIFFFVFSFFLFTKSLGLGHKDKGKIFFPSIIFPDVIPIGGHLLIRRHKDPKNVTNTLKNFIKPNNDTAILNISTTFELKNSSEFMKFQQNITENLTNNYIKENNDRNRPFHILECLTYMQNESLTPQLLICLSMFVLVLVIMICVQCWFQAKEKKEKEFQRIFKMAISENC